MKSISLSRSNILSLYPRSFDSSIYAITIFELFTFDLMPSVLLNESKMRHVFRL